MTQAKHTPGPWSYMESTNSPDYFEVSNGSKTIAEVKRGSGDEGLEPVSEEEGNAALIADAPEILRTLRLMAAGYKNGNSGLLRRSYEAALALFVKHYGETLCE